MRKVITSFTGSVVTVGVGSGVGVGLGVAFGVAFGVVFCGGVGLVTISDDSDNSGIDS